MTFQATVIYSAKERSAVGMFKTFIEAANHDEARELAKAKCVAECGFTVEKVVETRTRKVH